MEKASFIFESIAKELHIGDGLKFQKIKSRWNTIFPPPLSIHMTPVKLSNNQLIINVDSDVWLQELYFNRKMILSKLNQYKVFSIKLRRGNVQSPDIYTGNHSGQKIMAGQKIIANQKNMVRELNDKDKLFINELTDTIADEDLRIAIKNAITKSKLYRKE